MAEMPQKDAAMAYKRLIDALEEAGSCCRQIAFYRGQKVWLKIDEKVLAMREQIIAIAASADRNLQ